MSRPTASSTTPVRPALWERWGVTLWKWVTIHGCHDRPLFHRLILIECRWFKLMVHRFFRSDEDRELHDHPWSFVSLILWGGYLEETEGAYGMTDVWWRGWGSLAFRPATFRHAVRLAPQEEGRGRVWTLVLAGPRVREWGFTQKDGAWVPWHRFAKEKPCD